MRKIHLSLQLKFILSIVLIILPVLGVLFARTGIQNEKQATEQLLNQARIIARQVILTRQWISDCDGVLVLRESKGAKDTFYFYNKVVETPNGTFQQFTPSMVTKKLSQYSNQQDLYRFRIASLSPLNPENTPDGFEQKALQKFKKDELNEMARFHSHGEKKLLHYVVPLYMEKACLECHKQPEKSEDSIGGGLSVLLPIDKMLMSIKKSHLKLAFSGLAFILITISTLFLVLRHVVIKPIRNLEEMTTEIGKGNLDVRVNIKTGDEFETLGHAFNNMADRITKGRELFEEKITQATRELSEANQELKTLDKLKSDFLANMSHELRSPLTVIRGGIDYLNRTIKIEENRNYLEIIDKNLARLIHMVSDLFDFTKIEAKTVEWSFSQGNLTVLIEEIIEIMSPLANDKKIAMNYQNPGDVIVEFDLERIEQVLVNLIDNAIKFSDHKTEIDIKIKVQQEWVVVSVKDHGSGIPKENLDTIFDKFSTIPTGSDGKTAGTGLGLAICKAIIEAHNGKIWAESVQGESTTFYFTLPVKRP